MLDPLSAAVIGKLLTTKSATARAAATHLAEEKALEGAAKAVAGKDRKNNKNNKKR